MISKIAVSLETLERIAKKFPIRRLKLNPDKPYELAFIQGKKKASPGQLNQYLISTAKLRAFKSMPKKKSLEYYTALNELRAKNEAATRALLNNTHSKADIPINEAPFGRHRPGMSWQANRLRRALIRNHEILEIDHNNRQISAFSEKFKHNSPGVILREHNQLTTLPMDTPGREEIVANFRRVRANKEWEDIFKNQRGLFVEYGVGPRLSRHKIRKIIDAYRDR